MERELCRRCDIVFTTSRTLLAAKRQWNPETHLASHGVDWAHFARALAPETTVPDDVAGLKRPVLGFFGLVQDWIDIDLVGWLAEQRPDWTFVMIGKVAVDHSRWARTPNIKWLGRKPYEELPRYCKAFDVGLVPFRINELTRNVNPIKLREYLSAGVPVVSTALPECAAYPDWCAVADTREQFLAACEAAIAGGSPESRRARSELTRAESWETRWPSSAITSCGCRRASDGQPRLAPALAAAGRAHRRRRAAPADADGGRRGHGAGGAGTSAGTATSIVRPSLYALFTALACRSRAFSCSRAATS